MRKIIFILALSMTVVFTSCNRRSFVSGTAIPDHVNHIEFYNGGGIVGAYDNADIRVEVVENTRVATKDVSWYVYKVTSNGKTENIIDSEALAIKYY